MPEMLGLTASVREAVYAGVKELVRNRKSKSAEHLDQRPRKFGERDRDDG